MSGFTDPDPDLTLGDPAGVHIDLIGTSARIAVYDATGALMLAMDGTETFEGGPFSSFKVYDTDHTTSIAQMDSFQVAAGRTAGPLARLVHGAFDGTDPRVEVLPDPIAGATVTRGSVKATGDAANAGAALVLTSPTVNAQTPAVVTMRAADAVGVERIDTGGALVTLAQLVTTGLAHLAQLTVDAAAQLADLAVSGTATLAGLPVMAGVSGSATVVISASTFGTVTVPFGVTFPAAPRVGVTIVSGSGAVIRATVFVTAVTTTSCTIRVDLNASATVNVPVHWTATAA